jgi:glycosyltransferase involved in cell wall biosynthesis
MPPVTVIIPTYNYAEVLPYSIGSVLRQTFSDFELLVIGDHCTDSSESVVKSIGDSRVRWINLDKPAKHQSGPNNEGLRQGRGELVAYLGHDDLWLPRHLELAVKGIDGGADLDYALTEMVRPEGGLPTFAPQELDYVPGMWIPPTGVVHRRQVAIDVGGWAHFRDVPDRDPEADLWMRIHAAGARVHFTRMLTAVKFSAVARKEVYRRKPTHEQEEFTRRIQNEADFEAVELAKMLITTPGHGLPYKTLVRMLGSETVRRTKLRFARWKRRRKREEVSKDQVHRELLKHKGAERVDGDPPTEVGGPR